MIVAAPRTRVRAGGTNDPSSMRVLLVEDHPLVCEQVRRTVQAIPGADVVHVARTAPEATEWLRAHPDGWDLAIVDLFLAQGHGFAVLRQCRERAPHQRAVVLSNYTRDPVRQYARDAGADAVFDKSFELDALVEYLVQFGGTCSGEFHAMAAARPMREAS
jgi:DNA-binding NarL/FixJ family response regulator